MALSKSRKQKIINKFQRDESDTGSPEVQIALLTHQIAEVTKHLSLHPKDNHTRRGLVKMVSKRRRLIEYLKNRSAKRFEVLKDELKLKN